MIPGKGLHKYLFSAFISFITLSNILHRTTILNVYSLTGFYVFLCLDSLVVIKKFQCPEKYAALLRRCECGSKTNITLPQQRLNLVHFYCRIVIVFAPVQLTADFTNLCHIRVFQIVLVALREEHKFRML